MPRLFFSVVLSLGTESRKSQQSKRESRTDAVMDTYVGISVSDGRRDRDRVKEVLASGVPPKGLEARAFTFGGTECSM